MQCFVLIQSFLNILITCFFFYKFMVIFASRTEYELVFSQRKKSLNFSWGIWYMVNIWLDKSLKVLVIPLFFVSELRSVFEIFMYKYNMKDFRCHISKKKIFQTWNKYPFSTLWDEFNATCSWICYSLWSFYTRN